MGRSYFHWLVCLWLCRHTCCGDPDSSALNAHEASTFRSGVVSAGRENWDIGETVLVLWWMVLRVVVSRGIGMM